MAMTLTRSVLIFLLFQLHHLTSTASGQKVEPPHRRPFKVPDEKWHLTVYTGAGCKGVPTKLSRRIGNADAEPICHQEYPFYSLKWHAAMLTNWEGLRLCIYSKNPQGDDYCEGLTAVVDLAGLESSSAREECYNVGGDGAEFWNVLPEGEECGSGWRE